MPVRLVRESPCAVQSNHERDSIITGTTSGRTARGTSRPSAVVASARRRDDGGPAAAPTLLRHACGRQRVRSPAARIIRIRSATGHGGRDAQRPYRGGRETTPLHGAITAEDTWPRDGRPRPPPLHVQTHRGVTFPGAVLRFHACRWSAIRCRRYGPTRHRRRVHLAQRGHRHQHLDGTHRVDVARP